MLVLYLDPYLLGDPLFAPGLARDLAARGTGLVLVHGSGERGERALESLGRFPVAKDGVWHTDDAEGRDAVERATRQLNRELVHEMNEAGVSTVGALGADRGLLKRDAEGAGLRAGRAGWVADLAQRGVVIVVASLVADGDALVEADAARAAGTLARAVGADLAALTTRSVEAGASAERALAAAPDAAAVQRAAQVAGGVLVGPRALLRAAAGTGFRQLDP